MLYFRDKNFYAIGVRCPKCGGWSMSPCWSWNHQKTLKTLHHERSMAYLDGCLALLRRHYKDKTLSEVGTFADLMGLRKDEVFIEWRKVRVEGGL